MEYFRKVKADKLGRFVIPRDLLDETFMSGYSGKVCTRENV